ncbi:MAG TPA: putative Na+/H+ antiporter, partial [Verrucomicrobiae bacterium]
MNNRQRQRSGRLGLLVPATLLFLFFLFHFAQGAAGATHSAHPGSFPPALSSYATPADATVAEALAARIQAEPFNVVATGIFFLAILHTFLAPKFLKLSHRFEREHQQRLAQTATRDDEVSFKAQIFHFLGEVEAIFGIWTIPLLVALTFSKGWPAARDYLGSGVNFTEPVFVVVIMTIAASRPILQLSERIMALAARPGHGSPAAWWLSIVTIGPLLGSFITEPAAMTISALLLAEHFYKYRPPPALAYATLGLLFVNVSVGGTLTHFAAPPVLMVAGRWGWDLTYMLVHFGSKATVGIVASSLLYLVLFNRQFKQLQSSAREIGDGPSVGKRGHPVPIWIMVVHIFFLGWTVLNNHFPALFVGGFLFYLAFTHATEHHQDELNLRPALLVGFFLAGLVVHGGLQGWWIEPVLSRLGERPLFFAAATLTAFNDNAAITYLASLVPEFTEGLKYAVLSGAVVGGGLTVIANAPNPAGQSILSQFFPDGVSPVRLFLGALVPTVITGA